MWPLRSLLYQLKFQPLIQTIWRLLQIKSAFVACGVAKNNKIWLYCHKFLINLLLNILFNHPYRKLKGVPHRLTNIPKSHFSKTTRAIDDLHYSINLYSKQLAEGDFTDVKNLFFNDFNHKRNKSWWLYRTRHPRSSLIFCLILAHS